MSHQAPGLDNLNLCNVGSLAAEHCSSELKLTPPPTRFASLRLELVASALILVFVMSGTMGLTVAWIYSQALGLNQLEGAVAFARGAAMSLALSDDWNNYPWAALDRTASAAGFQLAIVSEGRGRYLHRSEAAASRDEATLRAALVSAAVQTAFDGRRFSVSAPVMRHGVVFGAICFAGVPVNLQKAEKASRTWMLAALVANLTLMGGFLIFFLNRRLVKPLKVLGRDLEDLGNNRFKPRLRPWNSWEINNLFESFDQAALELMASRRQVEEQLKTIRETRDHLVASEKMATVGRLASGLAHELGNPIGALTGFVHLLRGDELSGEDKKKILDQSAHELSRMDGSIKELLHFSRPARRVLESVDAFEVAEAAITLARPQKWAAGVDFKVETETISPMVMAQRNGLLQVVLNLLGNACQALAGAEGPGFVSISIQKPDASGLVRLRVLDNGPGVDAQDAPHLFEPYFTRKEPGQGTGLGLAVSLSIINEFGGYIDYAPSLAGGAVFTISLPAASEKACASLNAADSI